MLSSNTKWNDQINYLEDNIEKNRVSNFEMFRNFKLFFQD